MNRSMSADYGRIEKAILFLEHNAFRRPDLKTAARAANLSEYHFQRLFKRWAGISPMQFTRVLMLEHVKELLRNPGSLLDAAYNAGLSGTGRLHDLFVNIDAVTPDEFRKQGKNIVIRYGFHPTPFGDCLIAVSDRGIVSIAFDRASGRRALRDLEKQWKNAVIREDRNTTEACAKKIFGSPMQGRMKLFVKGTNFQVKVWQALLNIPEGKAATYESLAAAIGSPMAIRAVANAVARNPVAYLIPCHRVIRKTGVLGGYRWGTARKRAMLMRETGRNDQSGAGTSGPKPAAR